MATTSEWVRKQSPTVVGNSGGDLDSIVSALATARFVDGVPMAAFKRDEWPLRRDAVIAFKHYGMSPDIFAYTDDDPVPAPEQLVLVDHNRIEGFFSEGTEVVGVLDHHADEGAYRDAPLFRVVDPACGSTCSLVTEKVIDSADDSLLGLLLCAIALDARGFDPKKNKFNNRDVSAANAILDRLGSPPSANLRERKVPGGLADTVEDLAEVLLEARGDVGDLTSRQLLRMDYKQAAAGDLQLGAASVLTTLDELARRAANEELTLGELLKELAIEKNLDLVFAMTKANKKDGKNKKKKGMVYYYHPRNVEEKNKFDIAAFEAKLTRLPTDLPEHLAALPLFQSQNIVTSGLGADFASLESHSPTRNDRNDPLRYTHIDHHITRKTMLPTVIHFCS